LPGPLAPMHLSPPPYRPATPGSGGDVTDDRIPFKGGRARVDTPRRAPPRSVPRGKRQSRPMRVLIVEDDDAIATPLAKGLEREGLEVDRVETGTDALDRSATASFDV